MTARGTVSSQFIRRVLAGIAMRGGDAAAAAAAAGVPEAALHEVEARLPQSMIVALWEQAEARTGDRAFGLHLAELSRQMPNNAFAYAVQSSVTLGEALARTSRYVSLVHDGVRVELSDPGSGPARVRIVIAPDVPRHRHGIEFALAVLTVMAQQCGGPGFSLDTVGFRHAPPADASEHARIFHVAPRFGHTHDELAIRREQLGLPLAHADPALSQHLERHLDAMLARAGAADDIVGRLRRAIGEQLRGGLPDVSAVACQLKMSPRSLQRRLRGQGTSYQALLDDVRRELALRYLDEPCVSVTEVAFLVGFTEPSAFHRAFKRWTGTTPAEARRRGAGIGAAAWRA